MLNLIKKDFLLIRKKFIFVLIAVIIMPLFMSWQLGDTNLTLYVLIFTVYFSVYMICQNLSLEEEKHPKAEALLLATGYSRREIILSKYIFFFLLCFLCIFIYFILSLITPMIKSPSLLDLLFAVLFSTVLFCIYEPLQLKFGFAKSRAIMLLGIFVIFYAVPLLFRFNIIPDLTYFLSLNIFYHILIVIASLAFFLTTSYILSVKIYAKKEL